MAARKKATGRSSPYLTTEAVEDLSPAEQMAHAIVSSRADLLPSVERIMQAGLSDADTSEALTLFRTALETPGDPNRDPRAAVAAVGRGATL